MTKGMKCLAFVIGSVILIGGCNTKNNVIEYESESQQATSTKINKVSDTDRIAFSCTTVDGVDVDVDSYIEVPDNENMKVVEAEWIKYTAAEKERITKAFFGSENVFVYDVNKKEKTTNATEDYSENAFWGMKDNIAYVVDFIYKEYKEDGKLIPDEENEYRYAIYPVDARKMLPENIAKCQVAQTDSEISMTGNKCKYSEEEAKQIADDLLSSLGLDGYNVISEQNISWQGGDDIGEGATKVKSNEVNGYYFSYALPIDEDSNAYTDGADAAGNYAESNFKCIYTLRDDYNEYFTNGSGSYTLSLAIGDKGLMYLEADRLFDIKKVDSQSKLLSVSIVQGIIEDKLKSMDNEYITKHTSYDEVPKNITYDNKLSLHYDTQYQQNSDTFYYLPVWELEPIGSGAPDIRINAIDGTVIEKW